MKKILASFLFFLLLLSALYSQGQITLKQTLFELNGIVTDTLEIPIQLDNSHTFDKLNIPDTPPLMRLAENKSCQCFADAVHVRVHPGSLPLIELIVNPYFLNTAGTYELTFYYSFPNDAHNSAATAPMQAAVVTLVRPAAVLDTVPVVHIDIEGGDIKTADALVLRETGGKASIPVLKFDVPIFKGGNEGEVIKFDSASYHLDAGHYVKIKYQPQLKTIDKLPLGETPGQLLLNAPELKSPILIRFQISKTVSKYWIIVILFVGLLLGLLVRHLLQDNKQWEETRYKAIQLMQQIIAETQSVQDKPFRERIAEILNRLTPLMANRGALPLIKNATADLDARIAQTAKDYNEAKAEFEKELATSKADLKILSFIFDNPALNATLATELSSAIKLFQTAWRDLNEQKDVTDATAETDAGIQETKKKLNSWSDYLQELIVWFSKDQLYPGDCPPSGIRDTIKDRLDQMRPMLAQMKTDSEEPKDVTACAKKADLVFENKEDLIKFLDEQVAMSTIEPSGTVVNAASNQLNQALTVWYAALKDMVENPKGLKSPGEYWNDDIIKKLNAACQVAAAAAAKGGIGEVDETASETEETFFTINLPFKALAFAGPTLKPDYTPADYFDNNSDVLATLTAVGSYSAKKWLLYSLLQTVLLSLLLAAAAYRFYAPNFVGTFGEIVAIGLFAFSIDITADSVIQLGSRKT